MFLLTIFVIIVPWLQIDVLQAEVTALKTLVITSTPSMPNKHLHPQLEPKKDVFVKGHRRSTSHHNFSKDMRLKEVTFLQEALPEPDKPIQRQVCTLIPDIGNNRRLCSFFLCSSLVYHRVILSTQCVVAMLWSVVRLQRGQLRMVVNEVGSC